MNKNLEKGFRKFKRYFSSGKFFVNSRKGFGLVLDLRLRRFVKMHLNESAAAKANSSTLANDLGGVDEVFENRIINSGQSAAVMRKEKCEHIRQA